VAERRLERADGIPRGQRAADGVREHQPVIRVVRPKEESLLKLALPMRPEDIDSDAGHLDRSPAVLGLGFAKDRLAVFDLDQSLHDRERACVEVDILPSEAEQFPLPAAAIRRCCPK